MRKFFLTMSATIIGLGLTACATQKNLTKDQKCSQLKRQIVAVQQPNSGYSGSLSGYKADQLSEQAKALGC